MKEAICVLANNMLYTESLARNVPDSTKDNYEWYIFTETKIGNSLSQLYKIFSDFPNAHIVTDDDVMSLFRKEVCDDFFTSEYYMRLHVLMPWYIFKHTDIEKGLFTDEDVIIRNVDELFNTDHSLFYMWTHKGYGNTYESSKSEDVIMHCEWGNIFDLDLIGKWEDLVVNNNMSSGQRLWCKKDFDMITFEYFVKKFFNNNLFRWVWSHRTFHTDHLMDQKFEGYFAIKTGVMNDDMHRFVNLRLDNYDPSNGSIAVWHNGDAGKLKTIWLCKQINNGSLIDNKLRPLKSDMYRNFVKDITGDDPVEGN